MKLNIFSKKKEIVVEETAGIKKQYRVILKEKLTKGTTRTVRIFDAGRWSDPLDGVVYIKSIENQKKPILFQEIFPGDESNFIKYTEKELDNKIVEINKKLAKEKKEDDPSINQKNFEHELRKLAAQKRALKYNNDASYFTFGDDSRPEIIYLRESGFFTPFKWDTDTDTIYQPSEAKKKSVVATLRNKEAKYKTNDKVTAAAIIILIVGVILTIGNLWIGAGLLGKYDTNKIAELEQSSLRTLDICSQAVQKSTENVERTGIVLSNIAKELENKVTQPQIQGITPR